MLDPDIEPHLFPEYLTGLSRAIALPCYIDDLARIELALYTTGRHTLPARQDVDTLMVNPTLTLLRVSHKNLLALIENKDTENRTAQSDPQGVHVIFWRIPETGNVQFREAFDSDLLALKIVSEKIGIKEAAIAGGVKIAAINAVLSLAVSHGLLLAPKSLVRRHYQLSHDDSVSYRAFLSAQTFTLQWHITQACDLHCKHCYDRSSRKPLPLRKAVAILDDFDEFCHRMNVNGQVTFTGGNPLLYPDFHELYRASSDRGFGIALLGNPSPIEQIEALAAIQKPLFFQISLEGLESHNDMIRGPGHFTRSLSFLDQLRDRDIYTMVMLTLSQDNLGQVLPLADLLRERADYFTFNRLSTVGEGAQLLMAPPDAFRLFLQEYEYAAAHNPVMGLKDNLFNIDRSRNNTDLIGGCTGYGCGAAFNFIALLSDGEVHACRKFPSPIGNILQDTLFDIYHSDMAQKYRNGSTACSNCTLNIVCRGCLAITHSYGLNVFKDRDPFCFMPPE